MLLYWLHIHVQSLATYLISQSRGTKWMHIGVYVAWLLVQDGLVWLFRWSVGTLHTIIYRGSSEKTTCSVNSRSHWCQRRMFLNPQHIKLEADGYCSRRPHHALLSAKNRTDCLIQWHPLFWKESDRVSHARPASSSSRPQSKGMLVRLTCDSEGVSMSVNDCVSLWDRLETYPQWTTGSASPETQQIL